MIDLSLWGLSARVLEAFRALDRPGLVLARVVSAPGGRWRVVTAEGERLAEPAGRMLHEAVTGDDLPAVGDWLAVEPRPGDDRATVHAVLPRATLLARKAAGRAIVVQPLVANAERVLIACALDGDWNPARIERYVAVAWDSGAQPVVLLTKADLADDPAERIAEAVRLAPGAPVLAVSAVTGAGLDALTEALPPRETAALVGSSGVGKSTLVNRLLGEEVQPTTDVRDSDDRGRHTTTRREMFALPWGALLVDTPGLREIAVWTDEGSVSRAFDDVTALAASCRFRDCTHGPEPGCAVLAAVASGALPEQRLRDYRHLLREQAFLARKGDIALMRAERERWKKIGQAGRAAMRAKGKDARR